MRVRVYYLDDFNQVKFVDGELEVQVVAAPAPIDPGIDPNAGPASQPQPSQRPFWLRALRGFFGLGSAT